MVTSGYTIMITVSYIWLQWVTYGSSGLHMVTVGYIWFTVGYIIMLLHMVTSGYIWLPWVTRVAVG